MAEPEVDVPKVGPVNKKMIMAVGGVAAAYVLYRYYQARKNAAAAPADPGMADPGTIPAVAGTGGPASGIPAPAEAPSTDQFGFHGTTNSQWTQYATTQLVASDQWSYTDIVTALGQFLAGKPLSAIQVQIVQAAIALAGQPPEGSHPVISGGNVPIMVAPTGLAGSAVSDTAISLTWGSVAGASGYQVTRGGAPVLTVAGTSAQDTGLAASTTYTYTVAALASGGSVGPQSASVGVTTKAHAAPTPTPTPTPAPKPKPTGGTPPYDVITVTASGQTLGGLISAYNHTHHTSHSVDEVWAFNQHYRVPATARKLAGQGKNLVYRGQSFWVPK